MNAERKMYSEFPLCLSMSSQKNSKFWYVTVIQRVQNRTELRLIVFWKLSNVTYCRFYAIVNQNIKILERCYPISFPWFLPLSLLIVVHFRVVQLRNLAPYSSLFLQSSFLSLPFAIKSFHSFSFHLLFWSPGSAACLSSLPLFVKIILLPNWAGVWISLRIMLLELSALEREAEIKLLAPGPWNWLLLKSHKPAGIVTTILNQYFVEYLFWV